MRGGGGAAKRGHGILRLLRRELRSGARQVSRRSERRRRRAALVPASRQEDARGRAAGDRCRLLRRPPRRAPGLVRQRYAWPGGLLGLGGADRLDETGWPGK